MDFVARILHSLRWNQMELRVHQQSPAKSFPLGKTTLHKTNPAQQSSQHLLGHEVFSFFCRWRFLGQGRGISLLPSVSHVPLSINAPDVMDEGSLWMQDAAPSQELTH